MSFDHGVWHHLKRVFFKLTVASQTWQLRGLLQKHPLIVVSILITAVDHVLRCCTDFLVMGIECNSVAVAGVVGIVGVARGGVFVSVSFFHVEDLKHYSSGDCVDYEPSCVDYEPCCVNYESCCMNYEPSCVNYEILV